jgi:hypothetical protein
MKSKVSSKNSAGGMSPFAGKILSASLFLGVILIFVFLISKTGLGKALSELLGDFAGLLTAVKHQLDVCSVNFFAKGCGPGIVFISTLALTAFLALIKLGRYFLKTKNKQVEQIAAQEDKLPLDISIETANEIDFDAELKTDDGKVKEVSEEVRIKAYKKAFEQRLRDRRIDNIDNQVFNPDEREKEKQAVREEFEKFDEELKEGMEPEDVEDMDDLSDEMDTDPIPEPP